jgi:hypothetical protein
MSNLRLKDDLPTVIEGEGIASQDTLANEHLVTKHVDDKPEFAVYRHLRTRDPCIDGVSLPKKLKIHRYMH